MKNNIFNSSGKIIGYTEKIENQILIHNIKKPDLIINNANIVKIYNSKTIEKNIIVELYDKYTLTIGEIASIFGLFYSKINQVVKQNCETGKHQGRRNASFGVVFTSERKQKIIKGNEEYRKKYGTPKPYIRTDEIKRKISKGVHLANIEGRLNSSLNAKKGWENNKFKEVNFKRGIGGYITSVKMHKRFFFRSLLELYYIINFLEENNEVYSYVYEPFQIHCDNGSLYTPDFLINNKNVVELKSYRFIYKQGGKIQEKFEYKKIQAEKYCENHNLHYKIIFDKDIDFKYDVMKHQLKELNYIQKYKIEFLEPQRVWSRK